MFVFYMLYDDLKYYNFDVIILFKIMM